ncbi:hypothetical protein XH93_05270 [Bradyrhizobium sp. CCBAU 51753]|nr:hypothetical protein XH93_05270 [Bradyrhizobium sp. CCBAU 51753]
MDLLHPRFQNRVAFNLLFLLYLLLVLILSDLFGAGFVEFRRPRAPIGMDKRTAVSICRQMR